MAKEFTPWQRDALMHPHDCDDGADNPPAACMHRPGKGRSVILTCDIDEETAQTFGGPVWHVSVWPPRRPRAEAVIAGVGEGVVFDEPGVNPKILHLRKRMTTAEMQRLGVSEP
jgi:hypothetical protein